MQTPVPIFTHQTAPSMREYAQSMQAVPLNDQRRLYSDLAWAWPVISEREDCVREADLFVRSIRQVARAPVSSLLHLGCGGGHLDFSFKEHFSVTGVDLSPAMLSIAGQLNPEVVYLPGDMRSVRLEQTFDAVVIADSIDYMLTEQEMLAAFRTAFVHLKPGGIFCTYAGVTCQSFAQNETHVSTSSDGDTEITFIENRYDPDFGDTTYENAFVYLIRRAGQLEVETDRHLGGIFELETWTRLLHDAGFSVHLSRLDESHIHWFICTRHT
jgi:ubiquinone/menaquinone biosynthesis C-methylase UbiE